MARSDVYNYFRDYDPAIGKYQQSDPAGLDGGINTYAYVYASPISFVDYFGQQRGGMREFRERIPPRYSQPPLPPWLRNPENNTQYIPPPTVPPGFNEILQRDLEEAIGHFHDVQLEILARERNRRALERLKKWLKDNPFDDSQCRVDDQQRLRDYFRRVLQMKKAFSTEVAPLGPSGPSQPSEP